MNTIEKKSLYIIIVTLTIGVGTLLLVEPVKEILSNMQIPGYIGGVILIFFGTYLLALMKKERIL